MATETVAKPRTSARVHVQKFGTFLSGMIMPNIGAFIAWGLITALFIEKGWLPVPQLGGFGLHRRQRSLHGNGFEFEFFHGVLGIKQ